GGRGGSRGGVRGGGRPRGQDPGADGAHDPRADKDPEGRDDARLPVGEEQAEGGGHAGSPATAAPASIRASAKSRRSRIWWICSSITIDPCPASKRYSSNSRPSSVSRSV